MVYRAHRKRLYCFICFSFQIFFSSCNFQTVWKVHNPFPKAPAPKQEKVCSHSLAMFLVHLKTLTKICDLACAIPVLCVSPYAAGNLHPQLSEGSKINNTKSCSCIKEIISRTILFCSFHAGTLFTQEIISRTNKC